MVRILTLVFFLLVLSGPASAQTRSVPAKCAGAVSWQQAAASVGHTVTMKGRVLDAKYVQWKSGKGSMTFLDFGARFPYTPRFTTVVWNVDKTSLAGHTICVTGKVTKYLGVAEMAADKPSAIVLLN